MRTSPIPNRVIAGAAALGLVALLAGCTAKAGASTTPQPTPLHRSVTAMATGTAIGVPDNLQANLTIATTGPTAAGVLSDNNTRAQDLLNVLKVVQVSPKDVSTTSVNLSPTFDQSGHITGYSATNSVQVTLRNLATAGHKLDVIVQREGDAVRIDGVSLGFNDQDALLSAARKDAVHRARAQADEMATAGGASLGAVRTIVEESTPTQFAYSSAKLAASSDAAVPISAGSQQITVQVKAVYELN